MRQVEGDQADNSDRASQALSAPGDGHPCNDTDRKEYHQRPFSRSQRSRIEPFADDEKQENKNADDAQRSSYPMKNLCVVECLCMKRVHTALLLNNLED
jgi:hypothetical protein